MAVETINSEEFEQWVRMKSALSVLTALVPHTCLDILKGRIRSESIRIAAREWVGFNVQGRIFQKNQFVTLSASQWIGYVEDRFWDIGDHTIRVPIDSTGYSGTRVSSEIHGCRLDPAAFELLRLELGGAPVLAPVAAPSRISNAPPPITPLRHFHPVKPRDELPIDPLIVAAMVSRFAGGKLSSQTPSKAVDSAAAAAARTKQRGKQHNPVTSAEFEAWFDTLPPLHQALGYRDLQDMALKAFRPRHVVRKLAEDKVRGRGPGRKRKD
jgi:hypothetical protein